jgi:hypothetical protein
VLVSFSQETALPIRSRGSGVGEYPPFPPPVVGVDLSIAFYAAFKRDKTARNLDQHMRRGSVHPTLSRRCSQKRDPNDETGGIRGTAISVDTIPVVVNPISGLQGNKPADAVHRVNLAGRKWNSAGSTRLYSTDRSHCGCKPGTRTARCGLGS